MHAYTYFKNFFFCCGSNGAFAFVARFFELSSAVFNVAVDARPVEEVVA